MTMNKSESLGVGLAVGVPSFIVLTVTFVLWYRQQVKLKKEGSNDIESLGEEFSFSDGFHNSDSTLNKSDHTEIHTDHVKEGDRSYVREQPSHMSANIKSGSNIFLDDLSPPQAVQQQKPSRSFSEDHISPKKPQYKYYESTIPVLPSEEDSASFGKYARRISSPFFEKLPSSVNVARPPSFTSHSLSRPQSHSSTPLQSTPTTSRRNSDVIHSSSSSDSPVRSHSDGNKKSVLMAHQEQDIPLKSVEEKSINSSTLKFNISETNSKDQLISPIEDTSSRINKYISKNEFTNGPNISGSTTAINSTIGISSSPTEISEKRAFNGSYQSSIDKDTNYREQMTDPYNTIGQSANNYNAKFSNANLSESSLYHNVLDVESLEDHVIIVGQENQKHPYSSFV